MLHHTPATILALEAVAISLRRQYDTSAQHTAACHAEWCRSRDRTAALWSQLQTILVQLHHHQRRTG